MMRSLRLIIPVLFCLPLKVAGQNCIILSKANDINPDQLCSPVEVISWEVTYQGVNDDGFPVHIDFDWDDGDSERILATEGPAGTFTATATHTYVSEDDRCNYHPLATLVVNGVVCTSSTQEQIVTVWDNDNTNGGRVNASPNVYPICVGQGATMRFYDGTRFNCVPPQEKDNPNTDTRWIQWVYGTNITMTGAPVRVNGVVQTYPYTGPVIELPGPVTGSGERSLPITVADDKLVGQEFEVELRYWNYCNPWPGEPPVIDWSVIRIVDLPDATIDQVDTLCQFEPNIFLTAATAGGAWSGPGIVDTATGEFSPVVAGSGTHTVYYEVTDGNSCTASDSEDIFVRPGPDGTITPVDPFCIYDAPYDLEAASPLGTWSGIGITDSIAGIFDPTVAGQGMHSILFVTEPDANGCYGTDTLEVEVVDLPFAQFLTPDSAWCEQVDNRTTAEILLTGSKNFAFDLVIERNGIRDSIFNITEDTIRITLENEPGENIYKLVKVIEHHGMNSCERDLFDILTMEVYPKPVLMMQADYDDLCSPVEVIFTATPGYDLYYWDFGDGALRESITNRVAHTFRHHFYYLEIIGNDTIYHYDLDRIDTLFHIQLSVLTGDGCQDTITDSIRIYPSPDADFLATPEIQSHPDSVVYLINLTSVGNWSYEWDFGDSNSASVKEPGQHIYDTWGIYDIGLKTFSPYCRDSITKKVQILPPPPISYFEPDSIGCPPLEITFRNTSKYADTYIWDFDDGTYSTEPNPTHKFWQSKEHHVKLAAFGLSGADTSTQIVRIHERPQALFDVYPKEAKNLKQIFKFVNQSINGSYYLWDFGDGNSSPEVNPAHIYGVEGNYDVTLYVWSADDCPDTIDQESLIKVIAGEGETRFPNAFKWNGTGPSGGYWSETSIDNTVFHPNVINAVEFRMIIYTRWGEMIWETNELYRGWDGYLKSGELASPGVYVYKAWVTYVSGEKEVLTGDVTFLH